MSALLNDLAAVLELERSFEPVQLSAAVRPTVRALEGEPQFPQPSRPETRAISGWTYDPRWTRKSVNEEASAWGSGLRSYALTSAMPRRHRSLSSEARTQFASHASVGESDALASNTAGRPVRAASLAQHSARRRDGKLAASSTPARPPWPLVIAGDRFATTPQLQPAVAIGGDSQGFTPMTASLGNATAALPSMTTHARDNVQALAPAALPLPLPSPVVGLLSSSAMTTAGEAEVTRSRPDSPAHGVSQAVGDPFVSVLQRSSTGPVVIAADTIMRRVTGEPQTLVRHPPTASGSLHAVFAAQRLLSLASIADSESTSDSASPARVCPLPGRSIDRAQLRLTERITQISEALSRRLLSTKSARSRSLAAVRVLFQQCVAEQNAIVDAAEAWLLSRIAQLFAASVCRSARRHVQPAALPPDSDYKIWVLAELVRKGRARAALLRWRRGVVLSSALLQLLHLRDTIIAYSAAKCVLLWTRLDQCKDRLACVAADDARHAFEAVKLQGAVIHWARVSLHSVSIRARERVLVATRRTWTLDTAWRVLIAASRARRAARKFFDAAIGVRETAMLGRCFGAMVLLARRLKTLRRDSAATQPSECIASHVEQPRASMLFGSAAVAVLDAQSTSEEQNGPASALLSDLRALRQRYVRPTGVEARPPLSASRVRDAAAAALLQLQSRPESSLFLHESLAVDLRTCCARTARQLRELAARFSSQCVRNHCARGTCTATLAAARSLSIEVTDALGSGHPVAEGSDCRWSAALQRAVAADVSCRMSHLRQVLEDSTDVETASSMRCRVDSNRLRAAYGFSSAGSGLTNRDVATAMPLALFDLLYLWPVEDEPVVTNQLRGSGSMVDDVILSAASQSIARKCDDAVLRRTFTTWHRALFIQRVDGELQLAWRRRRARAALNALALHAELRHSELHAAESALARAARLRIIRLWDAVSCAAARFREDAAFRHWSVRRRQWALRRLALWSSSYKLDKLHVARAREHYCVAAKRRAALAWWKRSVDRQPQRRAASSIRASRIFHALCSAWTAWRRRLPARCLIRRVFLRALAARVEQPGESIMRTRFHVADECIQAWREAVRRRRQRQRERHLTFTARAHAQTVAVTNAFAAWLSHHRCARAAVVLQRKRSDRMRQSALTLWAAYTSQLRGAELQLLARVRHLHFRRCVRAWRTLTRELADHRSHAKRTAILRWRRCAASLGVKREVERRRAARFSARHATQCWLQRARFRKRLFDTSLAIRACTAYNTLTTALLAWQHAWVVRRFERARDVRSATLETSAANASALTGTGRAARSPGPSRFASPSPALPLSKSASARSARSRASAALATPASSTAAPLEVGSSLAAARGYAASITSGHSSSPSPLARTDSAASPPLHGVSPDGSSAGGQKSRSSSLLFSAASPHSIASAGLQSPPNTHSGRDAAPGRATKTLTVPQLGTLERGVGGDARHTSSSTLVSSCVDIAQDAISLASAALARVVPVEPVPSVEPSAVKATVTSPPAAVSANSSSAHQTTGDSVDAGDTSSVASATMPAFANRAHILELKSRVLHAVLGESVSPVSATQKFQSDHGSPTANAAGDGLVPLALSFTGGGRAAHELLRHIQERMGGEPSTTVASSSSISRGATASTASARAPSLSPDVLPRSPAMPVFPSSQTSGEWSDTGSPLLAVSPPSPWVSGGSAGASHLRAPALSFRRLRETRAAVNVKFLQGVSDA